MSGEKRVDVGGRLHSRRDILALAGSAGVMTAFAVSAATPGPLRRTPPQILGPYYPVLKPDDVDSDLTLVRGRARRAQGQVIYISGRVMNRSGAGIAGASMEIWQANVHGRYTHPSDHNTAPLDPDFEGFARLTTGEDGGYRFKTIKPAGYPSEQGARPPHIHYQVTGRTNRLVTQMYFAGEALNDSDRFLASAGTGRERLIVALQPPTAGLEKDALIATFDIVIDEA